ncbi:hypothetical protein PSTT_07644 [Puccinia striiformis]|uniref:CxC1-like cysteine cluster associated with KDZ transposases domain-containing protein n=1 Tax=Puccinia striiformis TaxID=27350 RepID=A0A2S4VFM3_9BASI|nr:hypothetical protein PSTT_07644 [Puccinia striiformis]
MADRTPRGRTRRPRNANAAAPLNTRRIIRTNTRIITVSRGQSRRARNAQLRRTEQQEPTERARQAAARQLGQRLGIILEQTQDQYEPEQRHQAPQPLLGSFVDLEDRDEWVDENPIADHAEYFRLQRHAAKREEAARKWAALDKEVVSAYLLYRDISQNWTSWKPDFSEKPKGCTCTLADISHRKVDLVDLFERVRGGSIKFCKCTPDVVRLIQEGFFACSADKPRTAFSIRLVQYHHHLWQASAVATSAFIKSLTSFLDSCNRQPLLIRGSKHKRRELRVPFSHCIDLYLRILTNSKKLFEDGLRLSPIDKWANKCPRCFGPIQNEVKQNPAEPDVNLNMDGNFQQRHYCHASKDCPRNDQYPALFLPPSKIASDIEQLTATEDAATGINAADDTRNGTTWDKCDDNGLFASTCRHDVPLMLINIYKTGEKLYYPISILRNFLADFPNHKVGVLYDIGCHLEAHITKRNLLSDRISDLRFGTSVFHSYVHEWSCQVKYNPRFNDWWGLTDGEGSNDFGRSCPLWFLISVSQLACTDSLQSRHAQSTTPISSPQARPQLHKSILRRAMDPEQSYHLNVNQTREKQRQELGKLLCLQDKHDQAWQANATTVEQGIARAAECRDIADRLSRHRITIGPHALIDNLDRNQSELLWKAWYSKIDVRQKYLALAEEKQPLLQACRPGEHTTLGISWFFSISFGKFCCRGITDVYLATVGTRANQRLILSVRDRGKELHAAIDSYTRYVLAFIAACPTRHAPPTMSYDELLRLQPDDPFWNDGLFTNGNEPWAIDINTQRGIRFLASLKRSREEHRRIGWEARRAMRWAIVQRNQLLKTLRLIDGLQVLEGGVLQVVEGTIIPPDLEPLLSHEYLSPLGSLVEKMKAGKMVVHEKLIEITKLLIEWDAKIVGVFEETPPQTGDDLLLPEWQEQIAQIMQTMQDNTFSNIPGDLHFQVVYPTGFDPDEERNDNDDNEDDSDQGEDQSIEAIDPPPAPQPHTNDNSESESDEDEDEDDDYIEIAENIMLQAMQHLILNNLAAGTSPRANPLST